MQTEPDAYCFFQDIEPQAPLSLRFERDYLLHAVEGALDVEVGSQRWLLPRSFAAWVPAGTAFKVEIARPVTSCSVLCVPRFCPAMPRVPVAFQMSVLTREMVHHCRNWGKEAAHPPSAGIVFRALLETCAELVGQSADVARPRSEDPALAAAIRHTEAHLAEPLAAADVAATVGLTERTLQRRFRSELGQSWSEVLTRIRMIRAVELLGEPQHKVITIAADCGFSSLSAFNRAFKAFAGQTPSAFRKRLS